MRSCHGRSRRPLRGLGRLSRKPRRAPERPAPFGLLRRSAPAVRPCNRPIGRHRPRSPPPGRTVRSLGRLRCPSPPPASMRRRRKAATYSGPAASQTSLLILIVGDLLHPINVLSVDGFLDGDVRHGRTRRSPVPMLEPRRKPHHVAGVDFFNGTALALHPSKTGGDNQRLSERVGM